MIPVLFPADAATFTSNGLGRLSDAITCKVEEERNGKYELEMEYPVDGIHFDLISHSCIIYAKPADGEDAQPFEIYEISKPIGGKCTIRAEHISYRLLRIPTMPAGQQTGVAQALQSIKTNSAETCPFSFWTDKTSTGSFEVKTPKSIRACLGGESGSILQSFGGGEYKWDKFEVKLYQRRGADNGVVIRYGKNLTDLTQEENIAETITGICPYWAGTNSSNQEVIVTLTEKVLHSANAGNYPYNRTAVLDCSSAFQNVPTESQLRVYAQNYITANGIGVPKVNNKIKFLPLWQSEEYKDRANIERVKLCDTVTVKFEKLGVDATAKVIKTKYNVLAERYDEVELGDAKSSMVKSIKAVETVVEEVEETQSLFRRNMVAAMNEILSGQDGDIIFTIDETTGKRSNIMAMNTSDPTTANQILMINYKGIGGFSNGLNDESGYMLAITRDGKINATAITTGVLNAALVKAGVLSDDAGRNYWNMLTGQFSLTATGDSQITFQNGSINLGNNFIVTSAGAVTIKSGSINLGSGNFIVTSAGAVTIKSGSINLGSGNFIVTSAGVLTANNASIKGEIESVNLNGGLGITKNDDYYVDYNYKISTKLNDGKLSGTVFDVTYTATDLKQQTTLNYDPIRAITSGKCGDISFRTDIPEKNNYYKGIEISTSHSLVLQCNHLQLSIGSGNEHTLYDGYSGEFYVMVSANQKRRLTYKMGILVDVSNAIVA